MSSTPAISIIIRTYNRAEKLRRAVQSALAQDWPNKHIIVMDDGSTDSTREVMAEFPQVEYHYQRNSGLQGCRHAALAYATAPYLAYLDSDDEWHADYLSRSMELFERFPESGLVFSNFEKRSFEEPPDPSNFDRFPLLRPFLRQDPEGAHYLSPQALREVYIHHIPAPSSAVVLRRELVPTSWDGVVKTADDWMEALHMIFHHNVPGAFWACPRWIKWCGRDSAADGAHDQLYRARNRTHDREIMMRNFRQFITPGELAVMKQDIVDHNFDAAYGLANAGQASTALSCLAAAFRHQPSARIAAAALKTCAKAVLPGKRAGSRSQQS